MSFILDALKKSEAQRQRADAPALYEVKMAPRRQGMPAWLLVLGGLLVVNIMVLSVVLLRGESQRSAAGRDQCRRNAGRCDAGPRTRRDNRSPGSESARATRPVSGNAGAGRYGAGQ